MDLALNNLQRLICQQTKQTLSMALKKLYHVFPCVCVCVCVWLFELSIENQSNLLGMFSFNWMA